MYRRWIATLHKQSISSWVCKATHAILWGVSTPQRGTIPNGSEKFPISNLADPSLASQPIDCFSNEEINLRGETSCCQSQFANDTGQAFSAHFQFQFHSIDERVNRITSVFEAELATVMLPCWGSGLGLTRGMNGPRQVHPGDLIFLRCRYRYPRSKL